MSQADQPLAVGFVGLGNLGAPMAMNLLRAGHRLGVWARRPETSAPFAEASAEVFADLAGLAARSQLLHVCVFDDQQVTDVIDGALAHMARGSVLVVHSTIRPATCATIAARAATYGVAVVDAPVSVVGKGGGDTALIFLVGGDVAAVEAARPALAAMGRSFHLGSSGSGLVFKALNNVTFGANLKIAVEALARAEALGLDRAMVLEVLQQTTGRSGALYFLAEQIDIVTPGHTAAGLQKDVGVFSDIVHAAGLGTGVLEEVALGAAASMRDMAAATAG